MQSKVIRLRLIGAVLITAVLLVFAIPAKAAFIPSNGEAATLVLGQPDFSTYFAGTTASKMYGAGSVAIDPVTHKVFVADINNNRVLRFASISALTNGAPAQIVLGQTNFTNHSPHTSQSGMDSPYGVFVDAGGRLWVSDANNNRVLRFDHASTIASGAGANAVLGQSNFHGSIPAITQSGMYSPYGLFVDVAGRLWVADWGNNRVLRFDKAASKPNGSKANAVLGQPVFVSSGQATSQSGMGHPYGVVVDAGGRLWVADSANSRVLRFNKAASKANGAKADGVLGQPNFTTGGFATTQSGMCYPSGVAVNNITGTLYVSDFCNSRILVFNSAAGLINGANANYVLGQANFTTGSSNTGGISAARLHSPNDVYYDPVTKVLLVADYYNDRVLMYGNPDRFFSATSAAAYDGWVLESTATSGVGGSKSAVGTLRAGDDAGNKQYLSLLYFNTAALPNNAMISSVTVKIRKSGVVGTDPFKTTFGWLSADIKKGTFGAAALQNSDFQASASDYGAGHFASMSSQPGWYRMSLPSSSFNFINLTGVTQFRLAFQLNSNHDHIADYDTFYGGDAASANRPVLTIVYNLP